MNRTETTQKLAKHSRRLRICPVDSLLGIIQHFAPQNLKAASNTEVVAVAAQQVIHIVQKIYA